MKRPYRRTAAYLISKIKRKQRDKKSKRVESKKVKQEIRKIKRAIWKSAWLGTQTLVYTISDYTTLIHISEIENYFINKGFTVSKKIFEDLHSYDMDNFLIISWEKEKEEK